MKKVMLAVAYVGIVVGSAAAAEPTFQRTKIPDSKGKQTPVSLVFSESKKAIEVSAEGQVIAEVPYASISAFSYEYTKKHRITQGAV